MSWSALDLVASDALTAAAWVIGAGVLAVVVHLSLGVVRRRKRLVARR